MWLIEWLFEEVLVGIGEWLRAKMPRKVKIGCAVSFMLGVVALFVWFLIAQ